MTLVTSALKSRVSVVSVLFNTPGPSVRIFAVDVLSPMVSP